MDLLTISDNKVIPSAYTLVIPEFKALSAQELGYVYYMCDHRSPFYVYDEEKRQEEVIASVFKKKYTITSKIEAACHKYKELTETSAVKLLKAAKASVTKLEKYFRDIDLTKMGDVVSGLSKLEEQVKKEEQINNANRGGVVTNKYSQWWK